MLTREQIAEALEEFGMDDVAAAFRRLLNFEILGHPELRRVEVALEALLVGAASRAALEDAVAAWRSEVAS